MATKFCSQNDVFFGLSTICHLNTYMIKDQNLKLILKKKFKQL
jgi:hypothetical protein